MVNAALKLSSGSSSFIQMCIRDSRNFLKVPVRLEFSRGTRHLADPVPCQDLMGDHLSHVSCAVGAGEAELFPAHRPKLDGKDVMQFDGVRRPYVASGKDNFKNCLLYTSTPSKAKFIGSSIFFIKKSKQNSFYIDLYIYFCKMFLRSTTERITIFPMA